jgi:hypothetical protein
MKQEVYWFLLIQFVVIVCKTKEIKKNFDQKPISIDSNLLIPWNEALQDVTTVQSPALYEFKDQDKVLWYLASQHSNRIEQPVFIYIDSVIRRKPDVIIVEGFETDLGLSPKAISESALQGIDNGFYPSGEPSYAIDQAIKNNIPFVGGEPNDKYIYQQTLKAGYSANDLLSFNFVRRLPQINRSGELQKNKLEKIYANYIKVKAQDFGYKGPTLSFKNFKQWYRKNQGKSFNLEAGGRSETALIEGPYDTQKISLEVTKIRDMGVLKTISDMMNKYKKVLIIYGSSHYRVEHKAIKASLGEPAKVQLAP